MVTTIYVRASIAMLVWSLIFPLSLWAAAAHRSDTATTYAGGRTNTTCTAPSGIQNGDVLLIAFAIGASSSAPTATAPAGFASVAGTYPVDVTVNGFNVDTRVWYKIASGESGDYTITHATASSQCYIVAVSGGSSAQPASTTNQGTANVTTALSITPVANESLVVFIGQDWADTATALSPPTGTTPTFTERLDPGTTAGVLYVANGVLATAGATGNKTMLNNNTGGGNSGWAGIMVVIEAAGGGPADETFGFRKRSPQ